MIGFKAYGAGVDYKRQSLTPKVDRRTVFIIVVDPLHKFSHQSERAT